MKRKRQYGKTKTPYYRRKKFPNPPYNSKIYKYGALFPISCGDQPYRKFAHLRYADNYVSPSIGAGSLVYKEYVVNGLYDIDYAIGGHQPYGFDELMRKYNFYTVLGCDIKAECLSSANTGQVWQLYYERDTNEVKDIFTATGSSVLSESNNKSKELLISTVGSSNPRDRTLYLKVDCAQHFGVQRKDLLGVHYNFSGDAATNPVSRVFVALCGYVPSGAADAISLSWRVTFDLYCCFSSPKILPPS